MAEQTEGILAEIAVERLNQDRKWGEQNHPDRPTMYQTPIARMAYGIECATWCRHQCDTSFKRGDPSWTRILLEEVAEAMDEVSNGDVVALRTELVQSAAVIVAWIAAIDRRPQAEAVARG